MNIFLFRGITRFLAALVVAGGVGLSFSDLALSGPSISQMADQCRASLLQIHTFDHKGKPVGSGTGFFIDLKGTLVTNHHVLEGCDRALLVTGDGARGEITAILKGDPERDLLLAKTTFEKTIPVPFRPPTEAGINDEVICFSNDSGVFTTISLGRVTDIIPVNDFRVIKISAPILPGVSGAPVLNRSGELMAIATAYLDIEKGLFFAVPADFLLTLAPVNLELKSLPVPGTRLGASLRGNKLVGLGRYRFERSNLTVFFKDGRHKQCDRAWLEGEVVYLVMKGKKFAVGYSPEEIDVPKSFGR